MATPSTDTILDSWLRGLEPGAELAYIDGRRLSANGRILTGPWGAGRAPREDDDLAEYLPAGRSRSRSLLLITGDEWRPPPFHSSIQWLARIAIERAAPRLGADTMIVPFSALAAANVIRSTVRPLEIRPDRETVTHEPIDLDLDRLESAPVRLPLESYMSLGTVYQWRLPDGRRIHRTVVTARRHVSGSGYSATGEWIGCTETIEPVEPAEVGAPRANASARSQWGDDVTRDPETGAWRIVHRRHWLGDSVFTAEVATTRRRRRPWTVADVVSAARDAIDLERNDTWRAQNVYRTSDGYSRTGASLALHRRLTADTVVPASRRIAALDLSVPIETVEPVRRRRRFISSFDTNEPRPLYYLATLPLASRARTVADAELDLAPAHVHAALARGRDVRRQGDIFLVETDLDSTAVYATCQRRARLTQLTRGARARPAEVGAYRPLSARAWRRIRLGTLATWKELTRARLAANLDRPISAPGARRKEHRRRLRLAAEVAEYRRLARGAVLRGNGRQATTYRETVARLGAELAKPSGRLLVRDSYRGAGRAALDRKAESFGRLHSAETSGRPDTRALLRETLAIYGTAHSATEVAVINGRPYVRGIVRHVPELIGERWRRPEHVAVKLPAGRWYLAIRNTVPRQ